MAQKKRSPGRPRGILLPCAVFFRVDAGTDAALTELAYELRLSRSDLLRSTVREMIASHHPLAKRKSLFSNGK
jgi:hypothetical protein